MSRWNVPADATDALQLQFGALMREGEERGEIRFPDLSGEQQLVLAGDYSGEHSDAKYQVVSLLLCGMSDCMGNWDADRTAIRDQHLADGRRHAFKKLHDASRQRALVPFLSATSDINGILLSVAIDKDIEKTDLGYQFPFETPSTELVHAKLIRIATFGALLVSGLGAVGQDVMWLTDDDAIVANDEQTTHAVNVIDSMLTRMCPFGLGEVCVGIAGKFDDNRLAEDLCAIPDLAGGAISETLGLLDAATIPRESGRSSVVQRESAFKAKIIYTWIATLQGKLSTAVCLVRPHESGGIQMSFANPTVDLGDSDEGSEPEPVSDKWRASSTSW
ncbi:hypothetical protein [Rhodopirellula islandica]|nr:hypothetical protein [Rhodopirellula islandica]